MRTARWWGSLALGITLILVGLGGLFAVERQPPAWPGPQVGRMGPGMIAACWLHLSGPEPGAAMELHILRPRYLTHSV